MRIPPLVSPHWYTILPLFMMEQVGTSQAEYAKLVHIARGEYPFRVDYGNDVDISSAIHDICRYAHTVHTRIVLARLLAQEGKIQRDVLHTVIACFNDQEKSEHQWDEQTKVEMSIRYTGMGAQFDGITLSHEVHKRWKIMKGTPLDKIFQIRDDL